MSNNQIIKTLTITSSLKTFFQDFAEILLALEFLQNLEKTVVCLLHVDQKGLKLSTAVSIFMNHFNTQKQTTKCGRILKPDLKYRHS